MRKWSLGIGHGMTRDNSRPVRPQHRKLTGQLEVRQHAQSTRPMGDEDLGATIGAEQGPPHEQPKIRQRRVAHQFRQCQLETRQRATDQLALDDPADGFDFRQLGHSSRRATAYRPEPWPPNDISLQRGRDLIHCTAECPARTISASLCEALCTRAMTSQVACLAIPMARLMKNLRRSQQPPDRGVLDNPAFARQGERHLRAVALPGKRVAGRDVIRSPTHCCPRPLTSSAPLRRTFVGRCFGSRSSVTGRPRIGTRQRSHAASPGPRRPQPARCRNGSLAHLAALLSPPVPRPRRACHAEVTKHLGSVPQLSAADEILHPRSQNR